MSLLIISKVLTESASYAEALSMLERALLTAPAYFIMAGKQAGQGAVVTRDRNFLTDLWALNFSVSVPNSWYILETNYVSRHTQVHNRLTHGRFVAFPKCIV